MLVAHLVIIRLSAAAGRLSRLVMRKVAILCAFYRWFLKSSKSCLLLLVALPGLIDALAQLLQSVTKISESARNSQIAEFPFSCNQCELPVQFNQNLHGYSSDCGRKGTPSAWKSGLAKIFCHWLSDSFREFFLKVIIMIWVFGKCASLGFCAGQVYAIREVD